LKILYVNSKSSDYVQDLTYTGLVKTFGFKNIIDYHWNRKYHVPYRKYPKNIGYVKNSFILSLFNRSIKDIDYVFIGSSKVDCFERYLAVIDLIPKSVPIVLIDGGDSCAGIAKDLVAYNRPDLIEKVFAKRKIDYIFKREYLINKKYDDNIFPLPMSFNYDRMPKIDYNLKYDVSFWAVESHQIRKDALDLLKDKFDCAKNGTERNQKFSKYKRKGSEYLKELARCKIVLNFRGGGWDTMRYWETPSIGGFMISQKPGIVIPNNFRNDKEVVFCQDNLSDLTSLCEYYLKNDKKRDEIAKNAMLFSREYHTDKKRIEYIFSKITKGIKL